MSSSTHSNVDRSDMAVTRGQSEETNRQAGSLGSTGLTKEKEAAGGRGGGSEMPTSSETKDLKQQDKEKLEGQKEYKP